MYQALQKLLETEGDTSRVALIYGNRTETDILLRKELEALADKHPDRFRLVLVVGERADDPGPPGWTGETGWVDEAKVKKFCHAPADDTCVFVCGVPPLYNVMCGPRNEKALKEGTVLHNLGYAESSVFKF